MPDGADSWYVNSPDYGNYEDAVVELIDYIDATYRTVPERTSQAIGGLSMGGYGAARFAIKYPDMFAAASIMSGAIFETIPEELNDLFPEVFGQPIDTVRYRQNLPTMLLEAWNDDTLRPAFYLTVGDDDPVTPYARTTALHQALRRAGVEAQLRVTDGAHAWSVWKDALDDTLLFFAAEFERYY